MTAEGRYYAKLLSSIVRFIQQRRLVPRKYQVWQTLFDIKMKKLLDDSIPVFIVCVTTALDFTTRLHSIFNHL